VSNGVLTLAANPADPSIKPAIDNYDYTSGMLTTQFSFSQTYGYFEMDAKLPAGQGLWPAFWLIPTTGSWRPEIDTMEVLGSDTQSLWQFSHPADTSYDSHFNTAVPDMSAGFHRYGVDWEPDKVTFYFDGQVTGVAPTAPDMNGPMYMIVNLALGGSWAGPVDGSTPFPADMQIDYIRAYEADTTPPAPTLAISPSSVSHPEGDSGLTAFTYSVTRSGDLSAASSAAWTVAGSGANPANAADFSGGALPSGALSFAPGQASATITIDVAGDKAIEPDEGFTVSLGSPTGATITGGAAAGAGAAAAAALAASSLRSRVVFTGARSGSAAAA
jgi:beta-glucanase (GH16 family)